jgi:malonyl-CoA O-methyltransferase
MTTSVRELFAAAAASYDHGNPLLALERQETGALLPLLAGRDVLDLGAGTGHYARLAAALGARVAIAIDITPEMLRKAPRPSLVGDASRLPFLSGCVDVVVGALLLSFVPDVALTLREVARVLRPGGTLVVSDLHEAASQRGWQRSFTGPGGERLVIDAPPPPRALVESSLAAAGLALDALLEPRIDERLRPAFERARRRDFDALAGTPLLQIFRARKGGAVAR